jgi:hypothetical protein
MYIQYNVEAASVRSGALYKALQSWCPNYGFCLYADWSFVLDVVNTILGFTYQTAALLKNPWLHVGPFCSKCFCMNYSSRIYHNGDICQCHNYETWVSPTLLAHYNLNQPVPYVVGYTHTTFL